MKTFLMLITCIFMSMSCYASPMMCIFEGKVQASCEIVELSFYKTSEDVIIATDINGNKHEFINNDELKILAGALELKLTNGIWYYRQFDEKHANEKFRKLPD